MSHVITSLCERAGSCVDVCPTDSIHSVEGDAQWTKYYINPETCIDCGACMAECPHSAIFPEDEVPGEHKADIKLNADFFTKGPGKGM